MRPENTTNRPKDVSFVLDQLTKLNAGDTDLKGKLDLQKVGVAGHSYGGHTVLALAGQTMFGSASLATPASKPPSP